MSSHAFSDHLLILLDDADKLDAAYRNLRTGAHGRQSDLGSMNRAVIVSCVSAWEAYIEQLVRESLLVLQPVSLRVSGSAECLRRSPISEVQYPKQGQCPIPVSASDRPDRRTYFLGLAELYFGSSSGAVDSCNDAAAPDFSWRKSPPDCSEQLFKPTSELLPTSRNMHGRRCPPASNQRPRHRIPMAALMARPVPFFLVPCASPVNTMPPVRSPIPGVSRHVPLAVPLGIRLEKRSRREEERLRRCRAYAGVVKELKGELARLRKLYWAEEFKEPATPKNR